MNRDNPSRNVSDFRPVAAHSHSASSWEDHQDLEFARRQHYLPVVLAELPGLIHQFPVAFMEADEGMRLVGVLGLRPGENLYITEAGLWRGDVLPLVYRTYPFALARLAESEDERRVLCVDHASRCVRDDLKGTNPFVTEKGELSEATARRRELLGKAEKARILTERAVQLLHNEGLLVPWRIQVETQDSQPARIEGLYKVDETRLNGLDDQTFPELRNYNALALAYGQLYSMPRLSILRTLAARKQAGADPEKLPSKVLQELGLDSPDADIGFDFGDL